MLPPGNLADNEKKTYRSIRLVTSKIFFLAIGIPEQYAEFGERFGSFLFTGRTKAAICTGRIVIIARRPRCSKREKTRWRPEGRGETNPAMGAVSIVRLMHFEASDCQSSAQLRSVASGSIATNEG